MDYDYNSTDEDGYIVQIACQALDFSTITGAVFIIIFIVSVIGNGLLLCILFTFEQFYLVTKIFIINLACSDLIFAASVPFWAAYHLHHWILGDFLCKFFIWVHFSGLYSSIFVLTAMTVDRFCTVVLNIWPNNNQRKKRCAIGACVVIWVISIGIAVYDAFKMEVSDDYYCEVSYSDELGYYFQIPLLLFVPIAIIIFCNCAIIYAILRSANRTRHKALSIVFCIVVAYIICWGPYNIVLLIKDWYRPRDCEEMERLDVVYHICRMLAFSHCCMNPLLCMLTQKFRSHLFYLLRHRVCINRERATDQDMVHVQNASPARILDWHHNR
ncbi:PREDICTED: chemokine XC receptor 1-like [Poecilia mexicana]|uniref:chemokine XC receptor 1-like n=2 Tax=Poecilia mexicana TaxID=48701 RepID=UPI00072E60E7|nr:PREDICTED: chemokine XC receptor 1-like [Poecilia mexicana]